MRFCRKNLFNMAASALLSLMLVMTACPVNAWASAVEGTGGFTLSGSTLTAYSGSGGNIVIPNTVTAIADSVFANKTNIVSCEIPSSVTSIGNNAFANCAGLTAITVPGSVTSMGSGVFSGCSALSSVSYQASVNSIPSKTFYGCSSLNSIAISSAVNSIGDNAFGYCVSLGSMSIPEGIVSVGSQAFANCTSLSVMSVPSTCNNFSMDAVNCSTALTNIVVSGSNGTYTSDGGCIYNSSMTKLLLCPPGKTKLVLSSGCRIIGQGAIPTCSQLSAIDLPEGVTTIEADAFRGAVLKSVTIPESVTSIGSQSSTFNPDVIYGYSGTKAEEFADDHGYIFYDLDGYGDESDDDDRNVEVIAGSGNYLGEYDAEDMEEGDNGTADIVFGGGDDDDDEDADTGAVSGSSGAESGGAGISGGSSSGTASTPNKTGGAYAQAASGTHKQDSTPKTGVEDNLMFFAAAGFLLLGAALMFMSKRKYSE